MDMYRLLMLGLLLVFAVLVYAFPTPSGLTVSFLNVGQGDAVLIQGPTGVQVLVDGGPSRAVLREVGHTLPFFDRSLDAVVATHPDQDHIGGLTDVLDRYRVGAYLESGNVSDTPAYGALERALQKENPARATARAGMRLLLGGGAYADVLFPDHDVSEVESNTASIILRVVYGDTEVMLTGDAPSTIERYVASLLPRNLASDILKAGHHGSKTSSSEEFVQAVDPKYVVYSRGCDNRYGHPAPETVTLFQKLNIPSLDTCKQGTVTFISDGKRITLRK